MWTPTDWAIATALVAGMVACYRFIRSGAPHQNRYAVEHKDHPVFGPYLIVKDIDRGSLK